MRTDLPRRDAAAAWLADFTAQLDEHAAEQLSGRVHADVLLAVPELAADADISHDTLLIVRAGVDSFAHELADDARRDFEVSAAATAFARTLARRGAELPVLLKAYRFGQSALWRHVMLACERELADPEVRMRVVTLAHDRLTRWIEPIIENQVALYQEERDRWLHGALAQRGDTIRALLRGNDVDQDKASRVLGYDLRRLHTGVALWAVGEAGPAHGRLHGLATELAMAAGAGKALTLPSGERGLWAWIGTAASPDLVSLAASLDPRACTGLRIAAGRPAFGPQGFCATHREALQAQRVAVLGDRHDLLTRYADVELACLLSQDMAAMRDLVARELGDLAASDATTRRLRDTARVFLACGSSARAAAEQLGTHKNTIFYRLRRIEETLGRPIDERRLHLELALLLADTLGEAAMRLPGAGVRR